MLAVSFLTPLDSLFVLAVAAPLAVLLVMQRRASRVRRIFGLASPGRRAIVPVVVALVALTALVAAAAAQPVVVRQQLVRERADAQAFFLFDTSLSMDASGGPGKPTRLARAKQLALHLQETLQDVPVGIAGMTDRALPYVMPTTDRGLFARAVDQSVSIDSPPPSQTYRGRATTFNALVPLVESHFYAQGVQRRLLVVFTDGESSRISPVLSLTLQRRVTPVYVHVWEPGERIYRADGRPDQRYVSDPLSGNALQNLAHITDGTAYSESQFGQIAHAARRAVGRAQSRTHVDAYARIALAPWFVLGGVLPLGFLLYRRNF